MYVFTHCQRRMSRGAGGLQPPGSGKMIFFRAIWQFFGPKNCQIAPDFSGKIDSAPPKKSTRTPMLIKTYTQKHTTTTIVVVVVCFCVIIGHTL